MPSRELVLASTSPRRRQLLSDAGFQFRCLDPGPDGPADSPEPRERVVTHAEFKARAGHALAPAAWVIAADTLVWCAGEFLPKPHDVADARRMLELLQQSEHQVWTGVALAGPEGDLWSGADQSTVRFNTIPEADLANYLNGQEWPDKAGAYGIQGTAGAWCQLVSGQLDTVIGLPVATVSALLSRAGACLHGQPR